MLRVKGRPGSTRDPWPVTKEGILTRPDPARGFFEAFLTRPDPARKILDLTRPDPAREKSQRPARPVMVFSSTRPTRDFFCPDPFDPWTFSVCNDDLTLQNIHTNVFDTLTDTKLCILIMFVSWHISQLWETYYIIKWRTKMSHFRKICQIK